jgi:predicted aldo/keto reductase-like oxidoreductase
MPITRRQFLQTSTASIAGLALGAAPLQAGLAGMPHRLLGNTGESVSLLSLGGAHMGNFGDLTDTKAVAIMYKAVDQGINFFDNAWNYSDGLSERRMGQFLASGYRDRVFLMSKEVSRDPKIVTAHLDESLQRLQTDRLDLWQFHGIKEPDEPRQIYEDGLLDAVLKARKAGKIRYIGFTGHTRPDLHVEMIERGHPWDTMQMPINVFDPHYLSFIEKALPLAVERGIGVIAMKTLAGTPGNIPATGAATVAECLRYAMSLPVSTVCSGMDSMEKLEQNIAVAKAFKPMSQDELKAILARTAPIAQSGEHEKYKAAGS